ncbi:MAG TPA: hypothetical protein VMR50_05560 [Myxococcota bacterium]|nr:hypothetical protein [Myxococcota bacterium]
MGNAKGAVLLGPIKFLRKQRERARVELPPELHGYLEEDVRLSAWYPEHDFVELIRAAARLAPGDPEQTIEQMGAAGARAHIEVYGELMRSVKSSSSVFALWSAQHDTGRLRGVWESPNSVRVQLIGFDSSSRENCLLAKGYIRGTMESNGCEDVQVVEVRCELRNDPHCEWRVTWKGEDTPRP